MSLSYKNNPDEIKRLEDFATDILIVHDRCQQLAKEAAKDNIDISNKLMNIYVSIKSEIRKHKPKQED
jgi:hypothetical protein